MADKLAATALYICNMHTHIAIVVLVTLSFALLTASELLQAFACHMAAYAVIYATLRASLRLQSHRGVQMLRFQLERTSIRA